MQGTGANSNSIRLATTLACLFLASPSLASSQDIHTEVSDYEGAVVIEHADLMPFVSDGFAGYLTIWNGSTSDKVIRSIEVESFGKADLAKRVSDDVVRSMLDTSVVTVPSKSELHMDVDTVFLLVSGSMPFQSPEIVVRFEDGSSASVKGRLISDRGSLTDHHHPSSPAR